MMTDFSGAQFQARVAAVRHCRCAAVTKKNTGMSTIVLYLYKSSYCAAGGNSTVKYYNKRDITPKVW